MQPLVRQRTIDLSYTRQRVVKVMNNPACLQAAEFILSRDIHRSQYYSFSKGSLTLSQVELFMMLFLIANVVSNSFEL